MLPPFCYECKRYSEHDDKNCASDLLSDNRFVVCQKKKEKEESQELRTARTECTVTP